MTPLSRIDGVAVALPAADIDTDQILPARFMHVPRDDYGRYCFHDLRFDIATGARRDDFPLNRAPFSAAQIVIAGPNFGCGSSREQAVHTLADFGIRALIGTTFGDIFFNNCLKNGVLPICMSDAFVARLFDAVAHAPGAQVQIDLPAQRVVAPDGHADHFAIDAFHKEALLAGLDEIDVTLQLDARIDAYEQAHAIRTPVTSSRFTTHQKENP
ncbi:3-isopropylmalate dehydratase small subunit [Paraburkholderia flava]|uniref:3-isopropylmalate dehydratase small subunit n=1 Tax=Paraburkholderia flava TaxID=2547393 RepID=UPI00105C0592|nr:3-isopropylmalate dehydratase small subunit [Paraburkholderia flava]